MTDAIERLSTAYKGRWTQDRWFKRLAEAGGES